MTTRRIYLTLTALLAVSLALYATSDAAEKFSFDYSSVQISDFNGTWEGSVDCRYQGGGFKQRARIGITDGVGALSHFGQRDRAVTAKLNLKNGKIKWRGEYKIHNQPRKSFSAKGKWMSDSFKLKGRRGESSCSGVLNKL